MFPYRDIGWRYWSVLAGLLIADRAGWPAALPLAIGLSAAQLAHFGCRTRSFTAFPVQVRSAYLAILLIAAWPPANWLLWVPAVGTPVQVLFGYCALARMLSLAPWNRRQPLSWSLVWRTFTARPSHDARPPALSSAG
jgi:hypothetical protein